MPNTAAPSRYTAVAQAFHWIIVALIVQQFALALLADKLPLGVRKLGLLARHKSFGMTILLLAVLRLAWRAFNPAPPLPAHMPRLERAGAHVSHYALYFLLFAMPLSGWLMSSAKNYSVSWFHLFTWPDLIGPNEQAFDFLKLTHDTLAWLLFAVASLHTLAALKHHFWDKDDVLRRMLPFNSPEKLP